MTLKSAIANSQTGELIVVFGVMPLDNQYSAYIKMTNVIDGNNKTLAIKTSYIKGEQRTNTFKSGHYNAAQLTMGAYTDITLKPIYVEKEMKSLKLIKFTNKNEDFEARDIPITWTENSVDTPEHTVDSL